MPSLCGSAEATRQWSRAFTADSFLACRPLRPREFDIDIQIFDADIFRLLENVSATAEIITVDNSTGLYRRTHYLSASLAASIPAWAQVSSWSAVPPLTPTAPICTLSSVMIGNPPANAIMPGTSASPGTVPPLRSLP